MIFWALIVTVIILLFVGLILYRLSGNPREDRILKEFQDDCRLEFYQKYLHEMLIQLELRLVRSQGPLSERHRDLIVLDNALLVLIFGENDCRKFCQGEISCFDLRQQSDPRSEMPQVDEYVDRTEASFVKNLPTGSYKLQWGERRTPAGVMIDLFDWNKLEILVQHDALLKRFHAKYSNQIN